jgi:H+/Cl- antiporter ClcA
VRVKLIIDIERLDKQFAAWVGTCVVLALSATAVCGVFSVEAQGSGIAELKTILSGVRMYKPLEPKTLVAKVLGLLFI